MSLDNAADRCYAAPRPLMRGRYLVRGARGVAILRVLDGLTAPLRWGRLVPPVPDNPRRILVCNWAHIGDVVLSLPALRALQQLFPTATIDLMVNSSSVAAVEGTGLYDRLHLVDHVLMSRKRTSRWRKLRAYLADRRRFIAACRAARYDLVIDLYFHFPSAAPLLWRSGIPVRCGFTSGGFAALLTHPVDWVFRNRPVTELPIDLIARLWPDRAEDVATLRPCYPGHGAAPDDGAPYVVIHTGAGAAWKEWPEANWRWLVAALAARGQRLVLSGSGAAERARAERLAAPQARCDLFIDRPWPDFVAMVAGAAGAVCLDSSVGHVAAAFAVPTVVIFGGSNEVRLWGPNNPNARVLVAPTGCAPCHRSGCDAMACIRDVRPEAVLDELLDLLEGVTSA